MKKIKFNNKHINYEIEYYKCGGKNLPRAIVYITLDNKLIAILIANGSVIYHDINLDTNICSVIETNMVPCNIFGKMLKKFKKKHIKHIVELSIDSGYEGKTIEKLEYNEENN